MWQGWSKCSPGGAGRRLYTPPVHPRQLQRTRNGYTSQAAGQTTQGTTHTPGRWTHCTNCTQYQTGRVRTIGQGAGFWTACATCPKLSRYGRLNGAPKQGQKSSLFCVCLLPVQLYKYMKKCYYNVSKSIH